MSIKKDIIIKTNKEYQKTYDYYINSGYKVVKQVKNTITLKKRYYGEVWLHVLLLVMTGWITLGLLNLIYIVIAYYLRTETITLILTKDKTLKSFNMENNETIKQYLNTEIKDETEKVENNEDVSSSIINYLED